MNCLHQKALLKFNLNWFYMSNEFGFLIPLTFGLCLNYWSLEFGFLNWNLDHSVPPFKFRGSFRVLARGTKIVSGSEVGPNIFLYFS